MYWIHALDLKLVDFDFTRNKHTCTKHPAIAKSAIIVILVASAPSSGLVNVTVNRI